MRTRYHVVIELLASEKDVFKLQGLRAPPKGAHYAVYVIKCKTPDHYFISSTTTLYFELHWHLFGCGAEFTRVHGVESVETISFHTDPTAAEEARQATLTELQSRYGHHQVADAATKPFAVYVLRCKTPNHFYIGMTSEFLVRLRRHFKGTGSKFTRRHTCTGVVSVSFYDSKEVAADVENILTRTYMDKYGKACVAGAGWSQLVKPSPL